MAQAHNLSIWEAEAGELWVQGQPGGGEGRDKKKGRVAYQAW
jgi:hypothetical protein